MIGSVNIQITGYVNAQLLKKRNLWYACILKFVGSILVCFFIAVGNRSHNMNLCRRLVLENLSAVFESF